MCEIGTKKVNNLSTYSGHSQPPQNIPFQLTKTKRNYIAKDVRDDEGTGYLHSRTSGYYLDSKCEAGKRHGQDLQGQVGLEINCIRIAAFLRPRCSPRCIPRSRRPLKFVSTSIIAIKSFRRHGNEPRRCRIRLVTWPHVSVASNALGPSCRSLYQRRIESFSDGQCKHVGLPGA